MPLIETPDEENPSQVLVYYFYIMHLLGTIDLMEFFSEKKITLFLLYGDRKI